MKNIIRVYDRNMNKLAYLNNAYKIHYELPLNELWTAGFTLPAEDSKNIYCQPFNYVEIFDGNERIELFRIMPSVLTRNTQGDIEYQCEHVLGTLLDDVLFKYNQIGNLGVYTPQVIRYVLERQDTVRWQLSTCDFDRQFEYKWENENLLSALFSIPQPFNEKYRWEFDTTGKIWRIRLKKLDKQVKADIIYKKNMHEIQKEVDPTNIVTRLYCLGYGEGDNQLGIESVNGGKPYLEKQGATATWGLKQSILVDRRFESPETLKAYGETLLEELKDPYIAYTTRGVDMFIYNPNKYERFLPGDIVHVIDKEDDIQFDAPIVRVSKSDVTGSPADIDIEIANKSRDVAGSISDLQDRARVNEVYAQGATNQMVVPYMDNADPRNPSRIRFYIPGSMVRINKCVLNYRLEPFRAYSKAVRGGGAQSYTSDDGGGYRTSSAGGGGTVTSSSGGGISTTTGYYTDRLQNLWPSDTMDDHLTHNHGIGLARDKVQIRIKEDGVEKWRTFVPSGAHTHGEHSHNIYQSPHQHDIYQRDHYHEIDTRHSHRFRLEDHEHDLEYGIYQGDTAKTVQIKVDSNPVNIVEQGKDINIINYLSKDSSGKINRDTWHEIEIIPDRMSRIVANIFMQIFTNSRGGGNY